jgi:hypothetical protein
MTSPVRELDSKVRAKRIGVGKTLKVEARTIGTPMTYVLATENVSRSGLLLHIGNNRKVPYRVNTLVELTVDRDSQFFDQPVALLGKIVRVAQDGDQRPQFGVHIIQLDGDDLTAWEKGVTSLEAGFEGTGLLPAAG